MLMPQLIKVFQIVIDKHLSDLINKEGWDCHVKAKSYIEAQEGRASIALANGCYTQVADIVADDINHAFEVGNIGPADRVNKITSTMRSVSVGDILVDDEGAWLVMPVGFKEVDEDQLSINWESV
tara:strand:- start:104 stop:478 length:375 start_codon:yes stop_codon:yes gene_type:complete